LLKGYYGHTNLGDDLLLLKLLEQIPSSFQITAIGQNTALSYLFSHRSFVTTKPGESFFSRALVVLKHDALLLGGGGLFPNKDGTLGQYLELIVALMSGKCIVITGISINPGKTNWEKWLWSIIVKRADFLSVRDSESASLFAGYSSKAGYSQLEGVDTLLSGFPAQIDEAPGALRELQKYALFIPAWFPGVLTGAVAELRVKSLAAEFSSAMRTAAASDIQPIVVSFYPKDDEFLLQSIADQSPNTMILRYQRDFNEKQILALMRHAQLCVCMRFHAFVAAVLVQRPSIVIAYDYKFTSLVALLGAQIPVLRFGISDDFCFGKTNDLEQGAMADAVRREIARLSDGTSGCYPNLSLVAARAEKTLSEAMQALER